MERRESGAAGTTSTGPEDLLRALRDPVGYVARARERAVRRRTPAQLFLVLVAFALMAAAWLGLAYVLQWLHWLPDRPGHLFSTRTPAAAYLMFLPTLLTSVGPGLLTANLVAHAIGPWRRILDREAEGTRGGAYASSQRVLVRISLVVAAATLPVAAVGVLLGR